MKFTLFSVCILIVTCNAGHIYGGHEEEHYAPAHYKFSYGVNDPHTGDKKQHWEHRDGDVVRGAYSFHEADGTIRVVEYTSDKHNGFNAVVKHIGHAHHPHVYGGYGHQRGSGGHGGESYVGATHWGFRGYGHY